MATLFVMFEQLFLSFFPKTPFTDEISGLELQASLEGHKAKAVSIEREFSAYKEEHKLSGDFGALQDALAVLQDQLREKKAKKK